MVPIANGGSALAFKASVAGAYASPFAAVQLAKLGVPKQDKLVWMQNAEPVSLYCNDETDGETLFVCEQINESLLSYKQGGGEAQPGLAKEWSANKDLTVWTFKLVPGVKWSDGSAFTANDVVFNTLPVFHAFGLLAGVLLPLFSGIRSFQYPSPLHYKIIPELCYDTDATVLFGTDTFLAGYAKSAHPYDFYNMRLIVAGAERLKPDTRNLWLDKFGLRIFEGYGVTECSPALSINTPLHFRNGSVGQMFDGIEYRVEPVPGIEKGGRLFVKGPNIMLGYLRADNPGVIEPPPGGWHDTGDIVDVDTMRYITILGRAKRFAKIAGEMISLTAIEAKLHTAFPDVMQAVVAVPDKKKGEQLVLFTTLARVDRKMIGDALRREGANELMVPKTVLQVDNLPLLGSGKTDYVSLNRMALDKVEA